MRYSVYQFVNQLSDSMCEAIAYVKKNPKSLGLLNDCTEALLSIKETFINEKGTEEVQGLMERFIEIISIIATSSDIEISDYSVQIDELSKIVEQISQFIKSKLTYQWKVVFFAELGAKWDAMDSVYRACVEREDCDVQVVLAPIFRAVKYPNGEVKSDVIYEDYLTPMGIECTSFKNYDIKKDLPDIVFTSQPYESVTTEQFWAENVAPYTHLVYLPYYTSIGAFDEQRLLTQSQMPMHHLAWKVVCQSEKAKKLYAKHSENKCKNFWVIGLPKWDWVVNMAQRDITMPKEWEKLKGKKIMLQSTHYLMKNPETEFEKIKIAVESAETKDYGIIFRFHPMLETMFKLYYPSYQEEWNKTKAHIENSSNCVIDKNSSYDCAFQFSDFLFAPHHSSLTLQYLLTGKPIICRDVTFDIEKEKAEYESGVRFVRHSQLGLTNDLNEFEKRKEDLLNGKDELREQRLEVIRKDMPGADGHIGERIVEALLKELKELKKQE